MIYRVAPSLLEKFPHFYRGVVVASNIDNTETVHTSLEDLLRQRIQEIEIDGSISIEHPRIKAWHDIYKTFPLKDASKIRPSIAALVRRIRNGKGNEIPFISPLVCISNLISLEYLVPSGLIDAERVKGDLVLGYAQGIERFEPPGSDSIISPEPGEIIYYDSGSKAVMCRAWNSRGGKATYILPTTNIAVIDVDGLLTVIPQEEVEAATSKAASLVREHCGAITSIHFLSRANPVLEILNSVIAS
jgi:DNA/RNA-binding domain of Phe-tRNA-synthetase-like protein